MSLRVASVTGFIMKNHDIYWSLHLPSVRSLCFTGPFFCFSRGNYVDNTSEYMKDGIFELDKKI